MFPKDAVKKVEGGIEVTMKNVISPLSVDEVPDDVLNYIEASIDDKDIGDEQKKQVKLTINDEDTFTMENAQKFANYVIPVGGSVKIFLPTDDVDVGEEHKFKITIKTDNPFELDFKRKVT
jgi:hypothetical protein